MMHYAYREFKYSKGKTVNIRIVFNIYAGVSVTKPAHIIRDYYIMKKLDKE